MSKLSFAVSSLVAVIPAAFMMYLLVMGFISGMPMILMVFAGLAMVCGVGVALFPILSFIIGPKAAKAPKAAEPKQKKEAVEEDVEEFGDELEEDEFGEELSGEDDWDDFEEK